MFGISEIAILLIVVILLLGAKKLPELARNAGKAARILKSETKAMKTDGAPEQQATYQVTDSRPHQNPPQKGTEHPDSPSGSPRP
ncbi:twin-arginine translocase TatA/TatE family subunit [Streptomyces roseicoloratus]|uniref:twin-arginine translocase TatA/TatE family subunit n=1 Tax=Streptomyces roseicoloratus TaxID=2508722 RepID=UPI001009FD7B|nr:twin-arginine translocase TatA/TatE family subunit [Streptomyces roseicoloratus]